MTGYINAFLAHDAQDFFLAEDGIFLFGNVDETVLADVKRSEIQIPHDLPAGSVRMIGRTLGRFIGVTLHYLPTGPI
ncbi:hypothetical protein ACLG6S_14505 [Thermodesulfobacteriota bacterium B35]